MPFEPGKARAARTAAASSTRSPVMMQPDCAPFSRSRRVSVRVSMPAIATMRPRCRNSLQGSGRAPAARDHRQIAHHQAGGVDLRRLHVLGGGAGVADVRIGQRDDLTRVGGIGEDFLIAGDGGIENDLSSAIAGGANGLASEDRPIPQSQHRRCTSPHPSPSRRSAFASIADAQSGRSSCGTSSRLVRTNPILGLRAKV